MVSQNGSISASVTPRFADNANGASFTSNASMKPNEAHPSSIDGTSTVYDDESHNFGILQNNCLPFLNCTTSTDVKSKSPCNSPPNAKKKVTSMLSFKRREGQSNVSLSKTRLQNLIINCLVYMVFICNVFCFSLAESCDSKTNSWLSSSLLSH